MENEKKYCMLCGKELQEVPSNMFDEYTGRLVTKFKQCVNSNCTKGCPNSGGHIFRAFAFWGPYGHCIRCGVKYRKI